MCRQKFVQVRIKYKCGHLYTCTQGILIEIQTGTFWNLIGLSLTAPSPVLLQQYSSTVISSLPFYSYKGQLGTRLKNVSILEVFFFKCGSMNCEGWGLCTYLHVFNELGSDRKLFMLMTVVAWVILPCTGGP
jgi:hypothetical protein